MNKSKLTLAMTMGMLLCTTAQAEDAAIFDMNTSILHIPKIEVRLNDTQVGVFGVEMGLISDDPTFDFKVTGVTPLEGTSSDLFPQEDAVRRLLGELLSGSDNLEVADEIIAPDAPIHIMDSFTPDFGKGPEAMKQIVNFYHGAFSHFRIILDDLIILEDKIISRFTMSGTQTGDLPGLPATGLEMDADGTGIYHLADGKIVEFWHSPDTLGMMQQLGAVPMP